MPQIVSQELQREYSSISSFIAMRAHQTKRSCCTLGETAPGRRQSWNEDTELCIFYSGVLYNTVLKQK